MARLFALHQGKHGAPRITADLRDAGWRVSQNTVAALMAGQHLAARPRRRRRRATRPGKGRCRAPDLVKRDFPAARVNRKWFGDGTEISTAVGKLHLALVMDVASGRVLGFALSDHQDAQLPCSALAMAVAVRGGQVPGVILHTDQGSEGRRDVPAGMPAAGRLPVDGPARVGTGQRRHRVLALHHRVRADSDVHACGAGLRDVPDAVPSGPAVGEDVAAGTANIPSRFTVLGRTRRWERRCSRR